MSEINKNFDENFDNYICQFTRSRDYLDETNDEEEDNGNKNDKRKQRKNDNDGILQHSLEYTPIQFNYHDSDITLPNSFQPENLTPYVVFSEFFSKKQVELIVQHTNLYAYYQNTKRNNSSDNNRRKWTELTVNELKIWLALVIYMGIFKLPSIEDYWKSDDIYPTHEITNLMSLLRFQQISRMIDLFEFNLFLTNILFFLNFFTLNDICMSQTLQNKRIFFQNLNLWLPTFAIYPKNYIYLHLTLR